MKNVITIKEIFRDSRKYQMGVIKKFGKQYITFETEFDGHTYKGIVEYPKDTPKDSEVFLKEYLQSIVDGLSVCINDIDRRRNPQ